MPPICERSAASDALLAADRAALVRLCRRFTGDAAAAEDLAQDTLALAWRHEQQLQDPTRRRQWLAAIARRECLRWFRRRECSVPYPSPNSAADDPLGGATGEPADDFDLELAVERDELAVLLDRAMALLPADTRAVLVERYIEESPEGEIALRLGLKTGTVAVRLHRGKLALRNLLTTRFPEEARAYGLIGPQAVGWQETRIWCPFCGQRRLLGCFSRGSDEVAFRCPDCSSDVNMAHVAGKTALQEVRTFRPAFSRILAWAHGYYRQVGADQTLPCGACGHAAPVQRHLPADTPPSQRGARGIYLRCPRCATPCWTTLPGMVLALPEVRRFWRTHPRIRLRPERVIEAAGRPTLVIGYESVNDGARIDVISACDDLAVLAVHGGPS